MVPSSADFPPPTHKSQNENNHKQDFAKVRICGCAIKLWGPQAITQLCKLMFGWLFFVVELFALKSRKLACWKFGVVAVASYNLAVCIEVVEVQMLEVSGSCIG